MGYDIKQVYNEAQGRPDWPAGRERMEALIAEIRSLSVENERLREENRQLREEVTLGRLQQIVDLAEPDAPDAALPPQVRRLLRRLPASFTFDEFFRVAAEEAGGDGADPREYLRLLLRERALVQRGSRIEKAAVETRFPPPLRLPYNG